MAETNNTLDQIGRDEGRGVRPTSLIHSFPSTSLDLENRLGTVGSDGTYTLQNASTSPLSPTPGGPALKNREGQDITQKLNTYTPGNTYMENIIKFREESDNELI